MVRLSDAHQRQESPKQPQQPQRPQPKKKKQPKPVRVVYISNPMRFTASAEQFRDLVQRLTGRESNVGEYMASPAASMTFTALVDADVDDVEMSADSAPVPSRPAEPSSDSSKSAGAPDQDARFEAFDEEAGGAVFAPPMWESLPAALYNYEALSRWFLEIN